MASKKLPLPVYIPYDPDRKPVIIISDDVKRRLQEIKTNYRLKSFNEAIELLLNENEKEEGKKLTSL